MLLRLLASQTEKDRNICDKLGDLLDIPKTEGVENEGSNAVQYFLMGHNIVDGLESGSKIKLQIRI